MEAKLTAFIIVLMASPLLAAGPKYRHTPNILNDEMENIYHDMKRLSDIDPLVVSSATISTATINYLKGTSTNDSAPAGYVGQFVRSYASAVSPAGANTWTDVTSISLTAGDWDVTAILYESINGATLVSTDPMGLGISPTSGTGPSFTVGDDLVQGPVGTAANMPTSLSLPCLRVSLSSTVTYYLKARINYSSGTPQFYGRITARRVR